MYTLFYKQGACSLAVNVLLRELGIEFTLEPQKYGESLHPRLAKINPRGSVPVLQKDAFAMREGGAILTWLCDEYDAKGVLLPKTGEARAEALQWLMFANATLHPVYGRYFFLLGQPQSEACEAMKKATVSAIQTLWDEVEASLEGKAYLCGDQITVADILISVIANWSPAKDIPISYGQRCRALFKKVSEREAFQEALKAEEAPYLAAA